MKHIQPTEGYDETHIQMRQSASRTKHHIDPSCAKSVATVATQYYPFSTNLCIDNVGFYVVQSRSKLRPCKQFVD